MGGLVVLSGLVRNKFQSPKICRLDHGFRQVLNFAGSLA